MRGCARAGAGLSQKVTGRSGYCGLHRKKRVDFTVARNAMRDLKARGFYELRAEIDVMAKVVDTDLEGL